MLRKIAVSLLSLLILLVVAFGYFLWFANTDAGRHYISQKASDALKREVVYSEHMGLSARWPLTVHISGLEIANMEGGRADKMVSLGEAEVSVKLLPLLIGHISLPYIALADSEVHLERTAEKTNWQFGEPAADTEEDEEGSSRLYLGELNLRNAVVSYYDEPQQINLRATGNSKDGNVVVQGDGTYLGQKFGLDVTTGELLSARKADPFPVDAKVTVGYTTAEAKGTIENPSNFSGLDVAFRLKGADAAELFPLFGIALPPTPPYDLKGQLTFSGGVWAFSDFAGTMGKSDISGNLKWDQSGNRPKFTAEFLSKKLDLVDLGPLIGLAPDEAVSQEQQQFATKREESPYLIPDVSLDISRLKAMDADVTYKGIEVVSPYLPLDDFLLHITLDNSLLRIQPVQFGTADGDVIAHLDVNARQEPVDIDADFSFSKLSLARLTESVNNTLPMTEKAEGMIGGTAKLKGTGKSLKEMLSSANGDVGIGMQGGQISNLLIELVGLDVAQGIGFLVTGDEVVPVRCVIGDFEVKNGLMQSRAVVIDTEDTNIQGAGTIDLSSEAMNLRIVPQPKDATLAALRVPLRVEGTLKSPDVSVEKGPLAAKATGAAALGIVLTPVASILALIEGGLGKDSNCSALITEMNANTSTTTATDNVPVNAGAPTEEPAPENTAQPLTMEDAPADAQAEAEASNRKPALQPNVVEHPGEVSPVTR